VVVREDLSLSQQLVQAAHATLEAGLALGNKPDSPYHLVALSVPDEISLRAALAHASRHVTVYPFIEPDLGNEMTAFASEPISGRHRKVFSKHPLWRGE